MTCMFCYLRRQEEEEEGVGCPFCEPDPTGLLRAVFVPRRGDEPVAVLHLPLEWTQRLQCIANVLGCQGELPRMDVLDFDDDQALLVYHLDKRRGLKLNKRLGKVHGDAIVTVLCRHSGLERSLPPLIIGPLKS